MFSHSYVFSLQQNLYRHIICSLLITFLIQQIDTVQNPALFSKIQSIFIQTAAIHSTVIVLLFWSLLHHSVFLRSLLFSLFSSRLTIPVGVIFSLHSFPSASPSEQAHVFSWWLSTWYRFCWYNVDVSSVSMSPLNVSLLA